MIQLAVIAVATAITSAIMLTGGARFYAAGTRGCQCRHVANMQQHSRAHLREAMVWGWIGLAVCPAIGIIGIGVAIWALWKG